MRQLVTRAIILSRTDYGEADRILTVLTPEHGKLSLLAKGVRRVKSKLAGGIELFSVSEITFIKGKGELGTLVSARLIIHYGHIVSTIDRTLLGYELIKQLHTATEEAPEAAYFEVLQQAFEALDNEKLSLTIIRLWFSMQLLRLGGHAPNLQTDTRGKRLTPDAKYMFSFDDMSFAPSDQGVFYPRHIKFLRLGFAGQPPGVLAQVQGSDELARACIPLVTTMRSIYIKG